MNSARKEQRTAKFFVINCMMVLFVGCSSQEQAHEQTSADALPLPQLQAKVSIIETIFADFNLSDAAPFAPNKDGWMAGCSDDGWRTDLDDDLGIGLFQGVQPINNVQTEAGDLGGLDDPFDCWITNGEPTLQDYSVRFNFITWDDDAAGIVFRQKDKDNFFLFYVTLDAGPGITPGIIVSGLPRSVLIRVKDGVAKLIDEDTFSYNKDYWNELRVDVITHGSLDDQTTIVAFVNGTVVAQVIDPDPILTGKVGLWAFGLGSCPVPPGPGELPDCGDGPPVFTNGTIFDDFEQISLDADVPDEGFFDFKGDGLPENVELSIGTDPEGRDSDDDTILDGEEVGEVFDEPRDTDGDGTIDALDNDSDGDRICDVHEAGDANLETPAQDSDLDGVPDYRDRDSNNDGVDDSAAAANSETCDPTKPPLDCDGDGQADHVDFDSSSCLAATEEESETTTAAATNPTFDIGFEGGGGCGVAAGRPAATTLLLLIAMSLLLLCRYSHTVRRGC